MVKTTWEIVDLGEDRMRVFMSTRRVALLLAGVVAIVVVAAVPVGAAGARINVSKYGFSFVVPANWTQIPLDGAKVNDILNKALKADPALKASFVKEVEEAPTNKTVFLAIGPVLDDFATNINIIVSSAAGYPDNNSYFAIADSQIKSDLTGGGFEGITVSVVHLPFGKELEATYTAPLATSGSYVYGLQLYIKHKAHIEIVTFTSSSQSADLAATDTLVNSWNWN